MNERFTLREQLSLVKTSSPRNLSKLMPTLMSHKDIVAGGVGSAALGIGGATTAAISRRNAPPDLESQALAEESPLKYWLWANAKKPTKGEAAGVGLLLAGGALGLGTSMRALNRGLPGALRKVAVR